MPQKRVTRSPQKSMKARPATAFNPPSQMDIDKMLDDQQHHMTITISEKEIEIDRLKTTVIALNHKASVVIDKDKDIENATKRLEDSEAARVVLQQHIVETSVKVDVDANNHNKYQDDLIQQIKDLQKQLEDQKQLQFSKDKSHR